VTLIVRYWVTIDEFSAVYLAIPAIENNTNHIKFQGNSITNGCLKTHPGFLEGKPYANSEISSKTTSQMLVL
tara:strand:- start:239 stop:454 length:216 start_codon:yes stop_codon:yes gene_type:complete